MYINEVSLRKRTICRGALYICDTEAQRVRPVDGNRMHSSRFAACNDSIVVVKLFIIVISPVIVGSQGVSSPS